MGTTAIIVSAVVLGGGLGCWLGWLVERYIEHFPLVDPDVKNDA